MSHESLKMLVPLDCARGGERGAAARLLHGAQGQRVFVGAAWHALADCLTVKLWPGL